MKVWCTSLYFYFTFLWRLRTHWSYFCTITGHLDILFCEEPIQNSEPFFFFLLICVSSYILIYKSFASYTHCQYPQPLWGVLFHSLNDVFWWTNIFYFNKYSVQVIWFFSLSLVPSVSCLRNINYPKATKRVYVIFWKCSYFIFYV